MGKARERRMRVPVADQLRLADIGYIQHAGAAIDIADIGAIWSLRIYICIMGTPAGVELRMPRHGRGFVALLGPRVPPPPQLTRLRRITDVERRVALIVLQVAR